MDALLLALVVYSAQVLAVVSVAAVASLFSREVIPSMRLTYWYCVSAVCVALPLFAPAPAQMQPVSVAFVSGTAPSHADSNVTVSSFGLSTAALLI